MADVPSVLNTQKYEEQKLTIRYFTNRIGLRICSYYWPTPPSAGNPKAVVVLIHGHGGYLPFEFLKPPSEPGKPRTYAGSWVETLNEAGYSVCGIDMEGMGRSEGVDGLRLYWNAFDDIVDDVLQLTRGLPDCDLPGFRGLPVFLLGQSLGGGVAAATMQRAPDLYRGAVLLCPMLSLEKLAQKPMNRILRPIVGLLNMTVPWLPAATPQRNEDCPEVQRDYDEDPGCYHGSVRVRVAKEYVDACARMMKALPDVTWPFIVFQSSNDQSVDPEGAEQLMAQAASTDKEIQWVNDMHHVLTKEAGNERILAKILPWLAARC